MTLHFFRVGVPSGWPPSLAGANVGAGGGPVNSGVGGGGAGCPFGWGGAVGGGAVCP